MTQLLAYFDSHPAARDFALYAALSVVASLLPEGGRAHKVFATLVADVRAFLPGPKP